MTEDEFKRDAYGFILGVAQLVCVSFVFGFVACMLYQGFPGNTKADSTVERLEQKIDAIHRVVVGGKP